jgi:5-methylcytosine-specific restriction endonuclease McrA
VCPACKSTKPLNGEFFHVSRASKTGFVPRCKVCALLTRKAYYQANAESEKQRHAEWVEANKERVSKLNARSRAKHLDKRKEYERGWRQRNRARILAKNRARKALIRAADREIYGDAELHAMWTEQGGACFYCHTPLFGVYHVEHKTPLSRGGTDRLTNICLACPTCNLRKGSRTAEEFMKLLA